MKKPGSGTFRWTPRAGPHHDLEDKSMVWNGSGGRGMQADAHARERLFVSALLAHLVPRSPGHVAMVWNGWVRVKRASGLSVFSVRPFGQGVARRPDQLPSGLPRTAIQARCIRWSQMIQPHTSSNVNSVGRSRPPRRGRATTVQRTTSQRFRNRKPTATSTNRISGSGVVVVALASR